MTKNSIYVTSNGQTRTYFALQPVFSDITGKEIKDHYCFYIRYFSKKGFEAQEFVCSEEEAKKIKSNDSSISPVYSPRLYEYVEHKVLNIVPLIPKGAFLHINTTPNLKTSRGDLSSLSLATKQLSDEVVIDKTRFSGKVCSSSDYESLEARDRFLLDLDEEKELFSDYPDEYLRSLQSLGEVAALEHKKTLLLEDLKENEN